MDALLRSLCRCGRVAGSQRHGVPLYSRWESFPRHCSNRPSLEIGDPSPVMVRLFPDKVRCTPAWVRIIPVKVRPDPRQGAIDFPTKCDWSPGCRKAVSRQSANSLHGCHTTRPHGYRPIVARFTLLCRIPTNAGMVAGGTRLVRISELRGVETGKRRVQTTDTSHLVWRP